MVKVITFSLWGKEKRYLIGAIKNAELALNFYPDFEYWFYIHKHTVPSDIIQQLMKIKNTKIIFKDNNLLTSKPMCWRFEAIDDENVEIMMPRDTDTRIFEREKLAVDEWLKSGKLIHIMRDHKKFHNYKIFGGMFGTRKIPSIKSWKDIIKSVNQKNKKRMYDLDVLKIILNNVNINNILVHTTAKKFKNEIAKDFPIPYDKDYNFVGCYIYEDDSRCEEHHNLLKK